MRAGWWEVRLGADSLEGTATGPSGEAKVAGDPAGSLGAKSGSKEQPAAPGPGAELGEEGGRREGLSCPCQPKQKKHLWKNLPPAHRN